MRTGFSALRVIVLGHVVRGPVGGMAWHHLQYVAGLTRLGHDVWFLEDSQDHPACYDPVRGVTDADPTYGLAFAAQAFAMIAAPERWSYHDVHSGRWLGPAADRALELCRTADLLLDMSGRNPLRPWLVDIPCRALVDTDPLFTQLRHLTDAAARERALHHTAFLTFGENIPGGGSEVPDDGLPWRPTRQPIVLEAWPVVAPPERGRLTSVMLWDSYPAQSFEGRHYGMKSTSFEPFVGLPARVGRRFELAVGSASTPKERLRARGWDLVDPLRVALMPDDYRRYIQGSRGEFGVAKHGYVVSRTGWFSERSAAYLASGRPVVVQDTGFSSWLRADGGVLPFDDFDGAVERLAELDADYGFHCRRARAVAEEYFDSDAVLGRLIEDATR